MHLPIEFPVYTYFLDKIPYYLLLHIVQDVFEVQIIVVVFNSFSYTALKQGRRLDQMKRGRNTEERWSLFWALTKMMPVRKDDEKVVTVICRNVQDVWTRHTNKMLTFFSKMSAVVSATAWRSSNTQRTQRNCGGRKIKNHTVLPW